ncbi:MAG: helix-turn-helix domain-containing protein [Bacillota bacterium]
MHCEQGFLTPKQVAELLQISHQEVLNLIHTGKLPAVKVSERIYRVRREDLEAYIAERTLGRKGQGPPATGGCG